MTTQSIRSGQSQFFTAQADGRAPRDEAAAQEALRDPQSDLAEVSEGARTKKPTAGSAEDARKLAMADQRAQQAYAALQKLVPSGAANATEAPRATLSKTGALNIQGTDANDVIQVHGAGDNWEVSALQNGEQVLLGTVAKSQVSSLTVDGGAGDDVLLGFGLDAKATFQGGQGSDHLISVRLEDSAGEGEAGPTLREGDGNGAIFNDVGGATLDGGAGANAILNRGANAVIGPKAGTASSDFVINEGDRASIQYDNAWPQQVHQFADAGMLAVAGSGSFVSVEGDENALALGGDANLVSLEGTGNAAVLTGKGTALEAKGPGNKVTDGADDLLFRKV